ncbi:MULTISPECIES: alpha/beta fold hydrolase [unclassified Brachybacterium]|uniref:alpha/beta fold hydrolase n=1 Tax=unclassified Brachybacterium TaxID=2623841 RepID=UPI0036097CE2
MKRLGRFLVRAVASLVVLALLVLAVRAVNGWRFDDGDAPDPTDLATYDLEQDGLDIEHVTGDYLAGFHLLPTDGPAAAGVVVTFGGSDGGPAYAQAVRIAQQGYEVYSLFFFGQENQQPALDRVPLEFFEEATDRIEQTARSPGPLTVIGTSKGAELALLLAEHYEQIDNVVLFAPTMHVNQSLVVGRESHSSWTLAGEEVPFLSFRSASAGDLVHQLSAAAFNYPVTYRSTDESIIENSPAEDEDAARLDPSAVDGGLLVFAGGDDRMWPADTAAYEIGELVPEAEVHVYPDAGHVFSAGEVVGGLRNGGTAEANEQAEQDSEERLAKRLTEWHR